MVLPQTLGNAENTFGLDIRANRQRPQFRGWVRISPVTFREEVYFPSYKRKSKYIVSAAVTLFMLSIAFFMMILSLNLQGYIRPKHAWTRHPFHFRTVAALAVKGSIFDANSLNTYIPVVLHATCIYSLNHAYRQVATWLTEFENHKTEDAFQSSLNFKRFLFEFFDRFIALFHLAFYERDVERLRMELAAVFTVNVDALRRLCDGSYSSLCHESLGTREEFPIYPGRLELNRVFEPFDVYMETLIQFGIVTLFASAYPMASVAMCVSVWIEIRLRTVPLYEIIPKTTCDQMLQYLPGLFEQTEDGETLLAEGKGRLVVLLVFGLERVLIFTGVILSRMVSDIPGELSIKLRRRQYLLGLRWKQIAETKKKD
ncbi:calcium-activated chloride channel-domain containing protein [Nitzschia inconspicua]|uniref:Calcium-activated chloride channel-domain containing protein n=1 Tax=Nitzschia inconspicua TaxID=303405 RepID=A0A9K3LAG4_9STRA|nr:calcium-activated chloride channel-domain containing protein [Nitzschia inconspicua]